MAQLNVYTASAGAGKTYTLALEYLTLALKYPEDKFRHILAMTFTNKATNEMKSRIVEVLYQLTTEREPSPLALALGERLGLSPEQITDRAQRTLRSILGDYSSFRVSTIDSFFQEVVRSFAFELNFAGNYKVEMDQELWLHKAIVLLLHSLAEEQMSDTREWVYQLAQEEINAGRSIQIDQALSNLGKQLFAEAPLAAVRDGYFPQKKEIALDRQAIDAYTEDFEAERYKLAEAFLKKLHGAGLQTSDLYGGARSPFFYYEKVLKDRHLGDQPPQRCKQAAEDPLALFPQKSPHKDLLTGLWEQGLRDILSDTISLEEERGIYYRTALCTRKTLNVLGTLGDINAMMMQQGRESNTLLLASTQQFIQRIIDNADAPFIYERLGSVLHHLMLDEFQDTARIQYENIRPLLENTLSSGSDNLIVGDVKQSIYKFRHCDRHILGSTLREEFAAYYSHHPLRYNWRSTPEVVLFNNAIFKQLPSLIETNLGKELSEATGQLENTPFAHLIPNEESIHEISNSYTEAKQLIAPPNEEKKGGIEVHYYPTKKKGEKKEEATNALNLPEFNVPSVILSLIEDRHYRPEEIAILANTNKEVAALASCLIAYAQEHPEKAPLLKFVSGEALNITNSAIVRFLISLLKDLSEGRTRNKALYRTALVHYEQLISNAPKGAESGLLPFDQLHSSCLEQLPYLSLYDLVESIIHQLHPLITPADQPYITALLDQLYLYHCDEVADLQGFLDWWEVKGIKTTLPFDDGGDAIRIMTIHKSKGLGFPLVLLPFLDWDLSTGKHKSSYIWSHPSPLLTQEIGCRLPIVPLEMSSKLAKTFYIGDYYKEKTDAIIDRLNLFYVAMTRAKQGIVLWLPDPTELDEKKVTFDLSKLLGSLLQQSPIEKLITPIPPRSGVGSGGKQEETKPSYPFPCISPHTERTQRIAIKRTGSQAYKENRSIRFGSAMHYILSLINTHHDVDNAVEQALNEGALLRDEKESIVEYLQKELSRPEVALWFSPEVQVFNEQTILLSLQSHTYRPDRIVVTPQNEAIVIDYKFGKPLPRYRRQVQRYMQLLSKMGYSAVRGYLWYFASESSQIEEILPAPNN